MINDLFDRELPCELNAEELAHRRDFLAKGLEEIQSLENERKSVAADFKRRIDAKRDKLHAVAREIRDRKEWRDVPCYERKEWGTREVQVVRQDTGEIVERRAMRAVELQTEFEGQA